MKHASMIISCILLGVYAAIGWGFTLQAKPVGSLHVNTGYEADFVRMTPIPMEAAVRTALLSIPGKAFKAELENADGYLVYNVGIVQNRHRISDVKVDTGSGKVLNIQVDGDSPLDLTNPMKTISYRALSSTSRIY